MKERAEQAARALRKLRFREPFYLKAPPPGEIFDAGGYADRRFAQPRHRARGGRMHAGWVVVLHGCIPLVT